LRHSYLCAKYNKKFSVSKFKVSYDLAAGSSSAQPEATVDPPEVENLESDEEVEEAEGLLKTPRKKRPSAGTPESTPSAPKKKRVKFSTGVADSTYVEVSDFPPP